jgi:hypothetical protein
VRSNRGTHRFRAGVASLLLVLLMATATSLAQDEDLNSEPQAIDQTPVVLSRTVTPGAINTVIEIPIAEDTYITSNKPSTNWCGSNFLRLGYSKDPPNNGAERMFLKFDLSSIPSDAAINSARFRIYLHTATPPGDGSMRAESRHLASDWNQCLVTWNSHQPHWGSVFGSSWVPSTPGWLEADATELVKEWVYGTHPNYGAMVMGDETVRERQRMFYSSRDAGGRYPRLIVDYTRHVDPDPPQVSVEPLPQWSPHRFIVSWSGWDPGGSGIDYYDVQYRLPGHAWIQWLYHTRETSAEFVGGANGTTYEYRARGVDNAGNVQAWSPTAQASTAVDSIPPTATVNPLDPITFAPAFTVSWTGSDNTGGSGIASFDVQVQTDGGIWHDWHVGTTATSAQFTGGQNGVTYRFRARATDAAGNVQPWSATAQAWTLVDTQGPVASIVPFPTAVTDEDDISVRWMGESSPNTSIVSYDVRYRFSEGTWNLWLSQATEVQDVFTDLQPEDGNYCFEVRARDSAGRMSNYTGRQCIAVDRYPPFIEPRLVLPLAYNSCQR